MPILFYCLVFLLLVISIRPNKNGGFLDKGSSNTIKGFFILLIVFSHVLNQFPYDGFASSLLSNFRGVLGQLCVSMFFFISGYGIVYSVNSKHNTYSKSLFTNRFLRILFYTIIGLIPFFIYSACLGISHNIQDYFLSLIGLASFGNESWFLFAILVCYLLCSIVYLFNFKKRFVPIIIISTGILAYVFFMYFFREPHHKWDTIICFVYGMLLCVFKDKINDLLGKKKFVPFLVMIICATVVTLLQYFVSKVMIKMWFTNLFFCIFFVALTKVFTLKSPVLSYLGKASYAIFIMHRLVICCFADLGTINNEWANYLVLFTASVAIGIPMYYIYKVIDKFITDPLVELNRNYIR